MFLRDSLGSQRTPVYCSRRNNALYDDSWNDRVRNEPGFMDRKQAEFMVSAQNESMHIPEVNDKIRKRLLSVILTFKKMECHTNDDGFHTKNDGFQGLDVVEDPVTRAELTPDYPPFCKRVAVHDDYWPAFNLPNVSLVSDPAGVSEITAAGPVAKGAQVEADIIIYATGFDSMDGAMNGIDVVGVNGVTLEDRWEDAAEAMWGIHVDGFPNMFIALGPGGLSFSMQAIAVCEENTQWAAQVITHMKTHGLETCDVKLDALKGSVIANQTHADRTVWTRCATYYNDDKGNILILTRRWDDVLAEKAGLADEGYPCFTFS